MKPNATPRKMPSIQEIYAHHGTRFKTPDDRHCMACKRRSRNILQRAHIHARVLGGDDAVGNHVLLCDRCHKNQELLSSILVNKGYPADGDHLENLLLVAANDEFVGELRRGASGMYDQNGE